MQEEQGVTPPALQSRPIAQAWMIPYLEAFDILSSQRPCAQNIEPIRLNDIMAYYMIFQTVDEVDIFTSIIVRMDKCYMGLYVATLAATKPKPTGQIKETA